jgi:hypothetical protein
LQQFLAKSQADGLSNPDLELCVTSWRAHLEDFFLKHELHFFEETETTKLGKFCDRCEEMSIDDSNDGDFFIYFKNIVKLD